MKTMQLSIVILLLISTLFLPDISAQDYTLWNLPKEAKARIGKGRISGNIVFSPDNTLLAVASSIGIWIYDAQTGKEMNLLTGHTDAVSSIAFSPDGKVLASGGGYYDRTVQLWDVSTGRQKATLVGHRSWVRSIAFSSDGKTLASGGGYSDKTVRLWDVSTGRQKATLVGHGSSVRSIAFSPDGKTLASGSDYADKTVRLWDISANIQKATLIGHTGWVNRLVFSPDGKTLVSGRGENDTVWLWDVASGELKATVIGYTGSIYDLASNPDDNIFTTESGNERICLISEQTARIGHIIFSGDGYQFASTTGDGTIRLWDAVNRHQRVIITGHLQNVSIIALSPDSQTLASGGWSDGKVRLWDLATGHNSATLIGHTSDTIASLAFNPDGKTLASGGSWSDPTVRLWNVATGTHKSTFIGHRGRIVGVAFSPDGKILVSASDDRKVCFWDVATGYNQATLTWNKADSISSSLAISPDGHILGIGDKSGIHLWDITNRPYQTKWTARTPLESFAYSPDGQTLVGGKRDGTIILWDAISGEEKAVLAGHTEWVSSVAFSPDGKTLASTGLHRDKTIRLWDVSTASHKMTLTGHTGRVSSLAFSPDGKTLVSGSYDGTILRWEFPLAQPIASAPILPRKTTAVLQNYPNPFNPETWIPYQLAAPAEVTVRIYTANGTLIRTLAVGHRPAGIYQQRHDAIYWDGKNEIGESVASGIYFYTLSAGDFTATRKMLIQK